MSFGATFDAAFSFTVGEEGGYSNNPTDPGGETKFGISKRAYPTVDIKNLTVDQAKSIYYKDFWVAAKCDQLPAAIAFALFDAAVNAGEGDAVKFLQRALRIPADGVLGAITLQTVARSNLKQTLRDMCAQRAYFYAAKYPQFGQFELGWLGRTLDVYVYGLSLGGVQ